MDESSDSCNHLEEFKVGFSLPEAKPSLRRSVSGTKLTIDKEIADHE